MFNDDITEAGQAFVGSAVSGIVSGQSSFVQLWNPADSAVNLFVDKVVCANSQPSISSASDLRPSFTALGAVHLNGFNRIVGGAASKAEVRAGHVASLPVVTGRMHEFWLSGPMRDVTYEFDPPLKVSPGAGLLIAQWVPSEHTIASWHWRETENTDPPVEGPLGNMTVNGGLAAAFDGDTTKTYAQAAVSSLNPAGGAYAGKGNLAVPLAVSAVRFYPTTDEGFDGNNGSLTFELYGSQSAPVSPTDGTLLGSLTGQADTITGFKEVASSDAVTAWAFLWVRLFSPDLGNHTYCLAQVEFT